MHYALGTSYTLVSLFYYTIYYQLGRSYYYNIERKMYPIFK